MLSPLQIERILKHCEKVEENYAKLELSGDEGPLYFDMCRNEGWCDALRLVLERNAPGDINNKPIKENEDE